MVDFTVRTIFFACVAAAAACGSRSEPRASSSAPAVAAVAGAPQGTPSQSSGLAFAGACVDPAEYTRATMGSANADIHVAADIDSPDLDHDGNRDTFIELEHSGKRAVWVFIRRGACGHFVGKVPDADLVEEETAKTNGLSDVLGASLCMAGRAEKLVREYRFDGTQYQLVAERPREPCPKVSTPPAR
jgi:hypothetical protein